MGWQKLLEDRGFVDIEIGAEVDPFGEADGERNARRYGVYGYSFLCRKP